MPGGNGTGPNGMGPMTGRGAGYCSGSQAPGGANEIAGRGAGFGFGTGRGKRMGLSAAGPAGRMRFRNFSTVPYQSPDPELVSQTLKIQADSLQEELEIVKKRLQELETETTSE